MKELKWATSTKLKLKVLARKEVGQFAISYIHSCVAVSRIVLSNGPQDMWLRRGGSDCGRVQQARSRQEGFVASDRGRRGSVCAAAAAPLWPSIPRFNLHLNFSSPDLEPAKATATDRQRLAPTRPAGRGQQSRPGEPAETKEDLEAITCLTGLRKWRSSNSNVQIFGEVQSSKFNFDPKFEAQNFTT